MNEKEKIKQLEEQLESVTSLVIIGGDQILYALDENIRLRKKIDHLEHLNAIANAKLIDLKRTNEK